MLAKHNESQHYPKEDRCIATHWKLILVRTFAQPQQKKNSKLHNITSNWMNLVEVVKCVIKNGVIWLHAIAGHFSYIRYTWTSFVIVHSLSSALNCLFVNSFIFVLAFNMFYFRFWMVNSMFLPHGHGYPIVIHSCYKCIRCFWVWFAVMCN